MGKKQKTIHGKVKLKGKGLHTGHVVEIILKPAPVGAGISFVRVDLPNRPTIKADVHQVLVEKSLPRCTSIGFQDIAIHTVEHLMAALYGCGVDNVVVEIDGDEIPGLDGSGRDFVEALRKVGVVEQEKPREYFVLKEPVWVERNGATISMVPADDFKVSYILDYSHPFVGTQFFSIVATEENIAEQIAPARTFCLENEAEDLRHHGLGLGADYANTLVITEKGVKDNDFRFPNELVRHKILDFIGDLYLFGKRIKGHAVCVKSGHTLNRALMLKIHGQQKKFALQEKIAHQEVSPDSVMDIHSIMGILPHRYPFLFVDRVIELEKGKRVVAVKNVTMNDYYFKGHFPTKPVMPGVIMVEAMAQAGGIAVLTDEQSHGKLAFFMGANNVKFRKVVNPGDQLILEAEVVRIKTRIAQIQARAKVDGQVVAEAEMTFSFTDAAYLMP